MNELRYQALALAQQAAMRDGTPDANEVVAHAEIYLAFLGAGEGYVSPGKVPRLDFGEVRFSSSYASIHSPDRQS